MASKSEEIRRLLQAEPGITPARLRDILKARGIDVDTHLIRVVRRNWIEAGRPPEKQPLTPAQIRERKQQAKEYARRYYRQWVKRKKEELARQAEERAKEKWTWTWLTITHGWHHLFERYGLSEELVRKHHLVNQYYLQRSALRRGAAIPPEDLLPDCSEVFPDLAILVPGCEDEEIRDLATFYMELLYKICTGRLTYVKAMEAVQTFLNSV